MTVGALGFSTELTSNTIPVISPMWRLKRSGDWVVVWKYDAGDMKYVVLSPLAAATLPLFDGRRSMRQVAELFQQAHKLESVGQAFEMLESLIRKVNSFGAIVVSHNSSLVPFAPQYDPFQFLVSPKRSLEQRRLDAPLTLGAMFSNNCETNCQYCYAPRQHIPAEKELSTAHWKGILEEAHELGIEQIQLSGGDPLCKTGVMDLIAAMVELNMLFLLSTKCHVTPEMADQLVQIGFSEPIGHIIREVQISLDGPDPETADVLAGKPGHFASAVTSIRNLVARGISVRAKAVITPHNVERVHEWAQMMHGLGVKALSHAPYERTFYRHNDRLFLNKEHRISLSKQWSRIRAEFPHLKLVPYDMEFDEDGIVPLALEHPTAVAKSPPADGGDFPDPAKAARWKHRAMCSGGRCSLTIIPDGRVVLCEQTPQTEVFVVGDLKRQSIWDVWHSDRLISFAFPDRKKFVGTECYDCPEFDTCVHEQGHCFRDSYFNYGTLYAPPPLCPRNPDNGMRMR